jgi:hypothetical protein
MGKDNHVAGQIIFLTSRPFLIYPRNMTTPYIAAIAISLTVGFILLLMGKNPLWPLVIVLRVMAVLCMSLASTLEAAVHFFGDELVANFKGIGETLEESRF